MTDESEATEPEAWPEEAPTAISLAEFLESVPQDQDRIVTNLFTWERLVEGAAPVRLLDTPEIRLHCSSDKCNGPRFFRASRPKTAISDEHYTNVFTGYVCSNCRASVKIFALAAQADDDGPGGHCRKFGEFPPYGPPTPSRLISLIGPDRSVFLKGRQCENHGLGIGAFAYYRRVVENQKNRIFENIIKVSKKLGADPELTKLLKHAQTETQFGKAVEIVKNAIPPVLLINGQNPITLLHSALSEGLHAQTDAECLEAATDIRIVLGELSERLSQALKDEAELNAAVARLMKVKKRE
ncbi:MAG: hypothetical protein ACLQJR_16280 [Stellaceae bacterium]